MGAHLRLVRSLPEEVRHQRVAGEWSVVETLRHLLFVYDAWFGRAVLSEAEPYHRLGLTAAFPDPGDFGLAADLRPDLDEVLAARKARQDQLRAHLATMDDLVLRQPVSTHGIAGFPPVEERSPLDCVRVILDEEWAHHRFAVRDLAVLARRDLPDVPEPGP